MTTTKHLPTLDIVGASTGILLGDMGGIYEVLNHVLTDDLMTHQLPAASRTAAPVIYRQHPWIECIDLPRDDLPALREATDRIVAEYGESLPLAPAVAGEVEWRDHNALQDLLDIAGSRAVIAVQVPGSTE